LQSPGGLYSRKKFLLSYLSWWLFWSLVQTIVLHRLGLSWRVSLVDAFVSNLLLGILAMTALILYKYYEPGKDNRIFRLLYALGITFLFCAILRYLLGLLLPNETVYLGIVDRSMPLRFVSTFMIISFITILNWLYNSLQDQKEVVMKRNESEQLAREAELMKLRQQLQPHFLFNSLNSISALAISRPEEARIMIQQLSDFLRGTLKKDDEITVRLDEEIRHLDLYLKIEKVRFGHRLDVQLQIDEDAQNAQIPPLLLQPLVENAIKFGLYGTLDTVVIKIKAQLEMNMLKISIENPYDEDSQTVRSGTGFGLSSVEKRLKLLYGRSYLLETKRENTFFHTSLKIPQ
jgi:sensor histidine kinase YesM